MTNSKNRSAFVASLLLENVTYDKALFIWSKYENRINDDIKNHGLHHTLILHKSYYEFLRNTILELPTQPLSFCKTDKRGIPKPLWSLRPLIKGNRSEQRLALSIVRTYEKIRLPIQIDLEPIRKLHPKGFSDLNTVKNFPIFLEKFTQKYPWYLGVLQKPIVNDIKVFTSLGKGPNGPAVATAHLDATAVYKDETLFNNLKAMNDCLGQSHITRWLENMHHSYTPETSNYYTGRLGFSAEPGGKTRCFAIGDYWSQTSLKIIQTSLYNTLKRISTDSTANQDLGFKTLVLESLGKDTYCFDLSSASDRIPAEMQEHRLNLMCPNKVLGYFWRLVMTQRNFRVIDLNENVRWEVGQPLGLLSSFPSFSLWHHDIVQYAYNSLREKKGLPLQFFKDYRILGDDIVIYNREVANAYQDILKELGIPINLSKSIIGVNRNSQIEFLKRISLRGKEYSSVKHNILSKNSVLNTLDLVDIMVERDLYSNDTGQHSLCKILSPRDSERFNFMFWFRSSSDVPFQANTGIMISRDSITKLVFEKRLQNLMDKTAEIDKILMGNKPLDEFYIQASIPYDVAALGLGQTFPSDGFKLHPLVWAVNQIGLDLSDALTHLWDGESLDVLPVEYLPIVSSKSFFHNRKVKGEFLSKILIDSFNELNNQCNINK
jgi:hypothetical protein